MWIRMKAHTVFPHKSTTAKRSKLSHYANILQIVYKTRAEKNDIEFKYDIRFFDEHETVHLTKL
jgi:hypothetical protein